MPNSRIEAATIINEELLESLGAWTTNGNNLLGGGGQLLGSNDFFGFNFITNGIVRGGFRNTGEFFLAEGSLNPQTQNVSLVRTQTTMDNNPQTIFSFNLLDERVFRFNASIVFTTNDNLSWGSLDRSITARRVAALAENTQETSSYTEREGNTSIDAFWERSGNLVELKVRGLNGQNVFFTGFINYFGV